MTTIVYINGLLIPEKEVLQVAHDTGFYSGWVVEVTVDERDRTVRYMEALVFSEDGLLKARCKWDLSKPAGSTSRNAKDHKMTYKLD